MAQPYIGEIRMFAGNFAPAGWAFCDGSILSIAENDVLFTLIGTTYGGDGESTFALPDLRGRVPVHQGNGVTLAQAAGVETVTLTVQQIPVHSHPILCNTDSGSANSPAGNLLATTGGGVMLYYEGVTEENMGSQAIVPVGGSQPHDNLQPYLCINYIISLFGIFPSQT